ncbi:protein involved in chromosome condensation [Arthrobacter sp. Hiyo4]|nr:protein involved in chromosome condensation [Arthrobacter sp. Hiyo4]
MSIATMLPMGDLTNPGQMRLALVQVVNWGRSTVRTRCTWTGTEPC